MAVNDGFLFFSATLPLTKEMPSAGISLDIIICWNINVVYGLCEV